MLAGGDGDGEDAGLDVGVGAVSASPNLASPVAATVATGIPAGMAMQVAIFTPGGDGAGRRLPVAYRDAVEVLAEARMPLWAMQVCQALGLGPSLRASMGMRVKLKRLVKRGWLVETSPGPVRLCQRGGWRWMAVAGRQARRAKLKAEDTGLLLVRFGCHDRTARRKPRGI